MTDHRRFGPSRQALPTDMSGVERLLAYEEIRQLASRYALAVDRRDLDALLELFIEDVKVTREQRGRAALREMFERMLGLERVSFLNIGGHVINILDRDHAAGTVYCFAEMGSPGSWDRQAIAYEDDYERRDGRWYFVRRNHQLFYGVDAQVRPLDQPSANWPDHQVGRGNLPDDWPTWQAFHGTTEAGN
jgi:ketosteroid isomerase-like protein